jgi:hypothetical protein
MSKLARALTIGAMLAAMNLAGMAAVAQAQPSDGAASSQDGRRPPTEAQVGESWRHQQVAPAIADNTQRAPSEAQVGESWHQRAGVPARPADPTGDPSSPVAWLGALAAVLTLAGGLAVMRASRKVRPGHAA